MNAFTAPHLRPELTELPPRIKRLRVDTRGYPVPWFVQWVRKEKCSICGGTGQSTDELTGCADDTCPLCKGTGTVMIPTPYGEGEPEFRAMDPSKRGLAIKHKLCWVCGEKLGSNKAFVAGPMCGVNRTSAEPPNHYECALWSALNCPFLTKPNMVRREDEVLNNQQLVDSAPGLALTRNPGVTMLWVTRYFECFDDGRGSYLIQMGDPERVEWYKERRAATYEEVMTSVRGGLPNLYAMAEKQEGGMKLLTQLIETFLAYLPPKAQ